MKRKRIIIDLSMAGLFCTLICVGAFIKIPIPNLPITMQVFFVLLAGLVLKPKVAFLASFSYLFLGLIGLPIFTGGGGLGYIVIPSFGYIIGFVFASTIMSIVLKFIKNKKFIILLLVSLLGTIIIYLIGVPYFALITNVYKDAGNSFMWFINSLIIPFIPKEIISLVLAALVAYKLIPNLNRIENQ